MPGLNLRSQLTLERSLIQKLTRVLEKERHSLIQMDIESLQAASEEKAKLLADIDNKIGQRVDHFGKATETEWDHLVMSHYPNELKLWESLKQELDAVLRASAANALAINAARARNRQLKDLLHQAQDKPNLYNRSGESETSYRRNIGCA